MTTKDKTDVTGQNALQPTGAGMPEGKEIVARGPIKYGLYSKDVVLRGGPVAEDPTEFEELVQGLIADLRPVGSMETIMVEKIAATCWRLKRLYRAECGTIKATIVKEIERYTSSYSLPESLQDAHDLADEEGLSVEKIAEEVVELGGLLNLSGDELLQNEDFKAFAHDKYPEGSIADLSSHQLKRLKTAYRQVIREEMKDKAQLARYLRRTKAQHLSSLIPDDRILKHGTTLERSLLKDMAALKQLQAMRKKD
jgi:hypothetical protein